MTTMELGSRAGVSVLDLSFRAFSVIIDQE